MGKGSENLQLRKMIFLLMGRSTGMLQMKETKGDPFKAMEVESDVVLTETFRKIFFKKVSTERAAYPILREIS